MHPLSISTNSHSEPMNALQNKSASPWWWIPTLYFAEGVPYFLVNNISVLLFAKMGVPNDQLAFFTTLLYFPWFLKGIWSPLVDVVKTKRWWIVAMQVLMTALCVLLALTLPYPDAAEERGYTIPSTFELPDYLSFTVLKDHDLRIALSGGFLCWQTNNARQNDAVMYGLLVKWTHKKFSLEQTLRGYSGWEHSTTNNKELAHDRPVVLKTRAAYRIKNWEALASYQFGMRDYPFHQLQLGAAYYINILGKIRNWENKRK